MKHIRIHVGTKGWMGTLATGLLGVCALATPLQAEAKDPAELTVQIDEKSMPVDLKGLKEGASTAFEHNGHKVTLKRSKGELQLDVDGDAVSLGHEGANDAKRKCVVKVGTIDPDDAVVIDLPENARAFVSTEKADANGNPQIHILQGDDAIEWTEAHEKGGVKITAKASDKGADKGAEKGAEKDGKQVIVQKRVMIEKTDDGIDARKVVVRCVGDAPAGGGDGKHIVIIRKEVEK